MFEIPRRETMTELIRRLITSNQNLRFDLLYTLLVDEHGYEEGDDTIEEMQSCISGLVIRDEIEFSRSRVRLKKREA